MKLIAHTDGACRTSIGLASGAAVLFDEHGRVLAEGSQILYRQTTPVAEYTGLIVALNLVIEHVGHVRLPEVELLILSDAELIVRQVTGVYVCRKPHLKAMLDLVLAIARPFGSVEVREFPKAGPKNKRRHGNEHADRLANECIDRQMLEEVGAL